VTSDTPKLGAPAELDEHPVTRSIDGRLVFELVPPIGAVLDPDSTSFTGAVASLVSPGASARTALEQRVD